MEDVTTISEELWSQHRSSTEDEKERRSKLDFLAAKEIVGLIEQLGMKKSMLARSNTECAKVLRLFTDFKALQAGSLKENSRNIYENGNQRERSSHDEGNQHSQHSQSTETTRPAALQAIHRLEPVTSSRQTLIRFLHFIKLRLRLRIRLQALFQVFLLHPRNTMRWMCGLKLQT